MGRAKSKGMAVGDLVRYRFTYRGTLYEGDATLAEINVDAGITHYVLEDRVTHRQVSYPPFWADDVPKATLKVVMT